MNEFIHLDNGSVSWSAAVSNLASALNPLGAAATIVAHATACICELNQIALERDRMRLEYGMTLAEIENRRIIVLGLLKAYVRESSGLEVAIEDWRCIIQSYAHEGLQRGISLDERKLATSLVIQMTGMVIQAHNARGARLVELSSVILTDNVRALVQ